VSSVVQAVDSLRRSLRSGTPTRSCLRIIVPSVRPLAPDRRSFHRMRERCPSLPGAADLGAGLVFAMDEASARVRTSTWLAVVHAAARGRSRLHGDDVLHAEGRQERDFHCPIGGWTGCGRANSLLPAIVRESSLEPPDFVRPVTLRLLYHAAVRGRAPLAPSRGTGVMPLLKWSFIPPVFRTSSTHGATVLRQRPSMARGVDIRALGI